MSFRFLLPGLIWTGVIVLFYFGSYDAPCNLWFNCIPGYAFLNIISFWGFSHIWIVAFRKQTKIDFLRRNAVAVSLIAGILFGLLIELIIAAKIGYENFGFLRFFMNLVGLGLGVFSFKTLYRRC